MISLIWYYKTTNKQTNQNKTKTNSWIQTTDWWLLEGEMEEGRIKADQLPGDRWKLDFG